MAFVTPFNLEQEIERLKALIVTSLPPLGGFKVVNIYRDDAGRLVVEYEDEEVT